MPGRFIATRANNASSESSLSERMRGRFHPKLGRNAVQAGEKRCHETGAAIVASLAFDSRSCKHLRAPTPVRNRSLAILAEAAVVDADLQQLSFSSFHVRMHAPLTCDTVHATTSEAACPLFSCSYFSRSLGSCGWQLLLQPPFLDLRGRRRELLSSWVLGLRASPAAGLPMRRNRQP